MTGKDAELRRSASLSSERLIETDGMASDPNEVGRELDSVDQEVLVPHETMLSGREPMTRLTESLSIALSWVNACDTWIQVVGV